VSFPGGSPNVDVTFESSGWFSKWFGNGGIRDRAASKMAGAAKGPAGQVLKVPLPQVNTFAVSHLLFPAENALHYADAYVPGDLALFGAIQPTQTAFTIAPLQATIAAGETQQFTPSNTQATTWTINPRIGTISSSGLYTAPRSITSATPVVITATQGQNIATAVTVVVSSPVTVSPSYTLVSVGSGAIQLQAAVLGGLRAPTWTLSPSGGSAGTLSSTGLYTPPTQFPAGVTLATATASTGGQSAASLLLLVDAVLAFSVAPESVVLGPNGVTTFTTTSTDVVWTLLTPSVGSLASNGTYTAPAVIAQPTTAVVQVAMQGNPGFVGFGVVILTPSGS
jgi:hypothetical protein